MEKGEIEFVERQYQRAIDARDKLNDNHYKWMSYYYLAMAGVIISITTLIDSGKDEAALFLSIVGIFVSVFWHLSCKGYSFWQKSWIYIILKYEKKLANDKNDLGVYSVFSRDIKTKSDSLYDVTQSANISTSKLTLLFSGFSIICWVAFSITFFYSQFFVEYIAYKILIILSGLILFGLIYFKVLPKYVISLNDNTHKLI